MSTAAVASAITTNYAKAVQSALKNDLTGLNNLISAVHTLAIGNGSTMKATAAQDLELLLRRLVKRFQMYQGGLLLLADVTTGGYLF